jgi:hypothetical protein
MSEPTEPATCKCCGQTKAGTALVRVRSERLSDVCQALIAYCGIEKIDLHTGTILLSTDIEGERDYYDRIADIRSELNGTGYDDFSVEYVKPS